MQTWVGLHSRVEKLQPSKYFSTKPSPTHFLQGFLQRFLGRFLHGSYTVPTVPTKTHTVCALAFSPHGRPIGSSRRTLRSRAGVSRGKPKSVCSWGTHVVYTLLHPTPPLPSYPPTAKSFRSMRQCYLRVRPERKKRPLDLQLGASSPPACKVGLCCRSI